MGRSKRAWRLVAMLAGMIVAAGAQWARAALPAADNASDAAYDDGWQADDNGGFGFAPWQILLRSGAVGVGSSTANGDAVAPTGDIDSAGGRAWTLSSARQAGSPLAVRPFTGVLAVGQTVSFDVDGIGAVANADQLIVNLGNATGPRWGLVIHANGSHMSDGVSTAGKLVSTDTREGIHVDVTLTGTDTFTASARVLDGRDPVAAAGNLDGAAGSAIDRISFAIGASLGSVDAYYVNNLAVTPEPGVGVMVVGAAIVLRRRKYLRRSS